MKRVLLFPSLLFLLAACSFPWNTKPVKKGMQGEYRPDSGLFDAEKGKTCRIDSAAGATLHLEKEHDNPLFESKAPNKVHLIIWWKEAPQAGQRYTLPQPGIEVCYWEKGDLLMFHTFKAQGWIEIEQIKEGKSVAGKMDLQLIEPHHNFSNSDFHYLGDNFRARIDTQND
jgi:hypothetical protein